MKRKILSIIILVTLILMCLTINSNAAMEVKADTNAKTSMSASDEYAYCYNLRANSSTLGNNTLDPHLVLNKDWGAVAYLAASVYGCNLNSTSISEYKTNGNNSGVMEFGQTTYTETAGIPYNVESSNYFYNLIANKDSKYVEILNKNNTKDNTRGQAFAEVAGWCGGSTFYQSSDGYVELRSGLFGYTWINLSKQSEQYSSTTFRPVIWNQGYTVTTTE